MNLKFSLFGKMPRAAVRSSDPRTLSTETAYFASSEASWSEDDDTVVVL